jgi:hypothetical protein
MVRAAETGTETLIRGEREGAVGGMANAAGSLWGEAVRFANDWFGAYPAAQRDADAEASMVSETVQSIVNSVRDSKVAQMFSQTFIPSGVGNPASAYYFGSKLMIAQKTENLTSFPATYFAQSDLYLMQYSNPQFLPTQIQLNNTYLGGELSDSLWQCWTMALGNHPEPQRKVVVAQQASPTIHELVALWRRGYFDEAELARRARKQGLLTPGRIDEWKKLSEAVPGLSDLLRMMVRDAADEEIVSKYRYDEDFNVKYAGRLKEWAQSMGIPDDVFRYYWRAHWDIPSNTQLFEMLHRLRPGRPEVVEWGRRYWDTASNRPFPGAPPRPPEVSAEEVREAIKANDVAPVWVDRLMAVSYQPITRTDAVRAYLIGTLDDAQLRHRFLDLGYTDQDARELVRFYGAQKRQRLANTTGTWTTRKITRMFKEGAIGRAEVERRLLRLLGSERAVQEMVDDVLAEMEADNRRRAVQAVRLAYRYGVYDRGEVQHQLSLLGSAGPQAHALVEAWTIERDSRYRQPTVKMITDWVRQMIISTEEARRRLMNLGYSEPDATAITAAAVMGKVPEDDAAAAAADPRTAGVVRNARAARQTTQRGLEERAAALQREMIRIRNEINRRLVDRGLPPLEQIVVP